MRLYYENQTNKIIDNRIFEVLQNADDIILFGGGRSGDYFYNFLKANQMDVSCFCDNYKKKQYTRRNGKMIYSFEEAAKKYPNAVICITSVYQDEIYRQIKSENEELLARTYKISGGGMNWETINLEYKSNEAEYVKKHEKEFEEVYSLLEDKKSKETLEGLLNYRITRDHAFIDDIVDLENETYFDKSIFKRRDGIKVYIDGGTFNGDTVREFINFVDGEYKKIICYEADPQCVREIESFVSKAGYTNIEIQKKALWNKKARLAFQLSGAGGSSIVPDGESRTFIDADMADDLGLEELDFVKLDIEGAEREALSGMRNTIKKCRPDLAICAYHKQDDLIMLPKIIREMDAGYTFYLRQYMRTPVDTVLYAVGREGRNDCGRDIL